MAETTGLTLHVLGDLVAARAGAPVALGGRRQRAVLAVLVLARGEVVSTERLADCLWGDAAPAHTSATLQSYVSHLRRHLQPEATARARDGVIARAGAGYALRLGTDAVDAWRFEQAVEAAANLPADAAVAVLDEALGWWRGPAYADYAGEPWVATEIGRLDELRAVARERLLAARLGRGESGLLVPELEALVADAPFREERWRLLTLALYRAHRQADALAALRRARDTLADALGVDPGPALRRLEAEVLAQSPDLDVPAVRHPVTVTMSTASVVSAATGSGDEQLVERDHELAALDRALDALRAGRGGVVLVEGPPGIGKTCLLAAAMRRAAAADVTVLTARASHAERDYAFGVARQLFESRLVDPARRAGLLQGPARAAAGVFDVAEGDVHGAGEFGAVHGLYWLTVHLGSAAPVLLAVDDLHWSDVGSMRFLAYLAKRLDGLAVLAVLARRSGEPHPEDALLAELGFEPATTVLQPAPLSLAAARTVVAELLDGEAAEPFVDACHRITTGNPLLLRQLLGALQSEGIRPDVAHTDTVRAVGSRAVSNLVKLRLRRLPPEAVAVARAVAVLGRDADLPTVAAVAGATDDATAAALDLLARSDLLRTGSRLAFVNPLVHDAVYDDLAPPDRALHHERAAAVLQRRGAATSDVARHLLEAPCRGREATVATLRDAAGDAVARGASAAAVALLRRALDEPCREGPDRDALTAELEAARAEAARVDAAPDGRSSPQAVRKSPVPQ